MPLSRVLLAAPDLRAVALHEAFLTRQGFDVAVCGDGLGCVERLRRDAPDLLVLSLDLPWGRGEGVLALMADGELPLVPVLLLTDRPYSPRLAAIGRLSVRSYLSWPAPPRLLGRAIREALADVAIGHPSPEMDLPANEWAAAGPQPTA